jgi:kynurenine 3-monooxygenase
MEMDETKPKCLVVGAGPVGALAALYAAKRGWKVEVYELRGGITCINKVDEYAV